mmetsp:Transcript_3396/g.13499  ORF Transcript_3396/g.13499 Transcript_3396/m.13499 type:complete len:246 (+) Transcript_3396:994-1731(+)
MHRCRYPERAVLTAVSTRPSRPAMQWKKYSWGLRPEKNRSSMYPPARWDRSKGWKHGRVFPEIMRGTRRPSSSCCPKQAAICEKFTIEPFAPDCVISDRQFFGNGFLVPCGRHLVTAADVILFSAPDDRMSRIASAPSRSASLAAICCRSAASGTFSSASANVAAALLHAAAALASSSARPTSASGVRMRSSSPHVMPHFCSHTVRSRDNTDSRSPASTRPCSSATACTSPLLPNVFLSTMPQHT